MSTRRPGLETKNSIRRRTLAGTEHRSGKAVLDDIPWQQMSNAIGSALRSLLRGRNELRKAHAAHLVKNANDKAVKDLKMTFALDGRLVGDIGELIAAEAFHIDLLGTKSRNIDAETTSGPKRKVQIKATFKDDGLAIKHGRDYFVGLQLRDDASYRVVYNGPARPVMTYLRSPASDGKSGRSEAGKSLQSISLGTWAVLNLAVPDQQRIPSRSS